MEQIKLEKEFKFYKEIKKWYCTVWGTRVGKQSVIGYGTAKTREKSESIALKDFHRSLKEWRVHENYEKTMVEETIFA